MGRTPSKASAIHVREMRPEYHFDYRQGRPNRFASRMGRHTVVVVLEPDVARVFNTSESVNELLRSVIAAFPKRAQASAGPRRRKKAG